MKLETVETQTLPFSGARPAAVPGIQNLFITGANGYLGRELVKLAAQNGGRVVGIGMGPWPPEVPLPVGAEFVQTGWEDPERVKHLMNGCDSLIHAAGLHLRNGREQGLAEYIRVNVEATARYLEEGVALGIRRFALCSSMTVQTGVDWLGAGLAVVDETSGFRAGHPYPLSKLLMERLAREFALAQNVSAACLRFTAFGHGRASQGPDLIARYVSPRDAARACLTALTTGEWRGEAFNISSGTALTNQDIHKAVKDPAAVLERLWPGAVAVCERAARPVTAEDFWPLVSTAKAKRLLGWEAENTFEAWLGDHGWTR